jgi:hypothetical protein
VPSPLRRAISGGAVRNAGRATALIPGLSVYKGNYNNAAFFSTNRKVPQDFISEAIGRYRDRGLATVQADVFGHSMGGVLARRWVGDPDYMSDETYRLGDVHKLITIDSPHYGSPLADAVFEKQESLANFMRKMKKPIDQGAIEDLRTSSSEITNLNATAIGIPVHAIFGNYQFEGTKTEDFPERSTSWGWWGLAQLDIDTTRQTNFPNGTDGIVGVKSQQSGLSASSIHVEDRIHTNAPDDDLNGCLETDALANHAQALLNAGPGDDLFQQGFPTASLPFPQGLSPPRQSARQFVTGGLTITSPPEGTTVAPDDSVSVVVEPATGVNFVRLSLATPKSAQYLEALPAFRTAVPDPWREGAAGGRRSSRIKRLRHAIRCHRPCAGPFRVEPSETQEEPTSIPRLLLSR